MVTFVRREQPDKYELWLKGKDIVGQTEDPSHRLYRALKR